MLGKDSLLLETLELIACSSGFSLFQDCLVQRLLGIPVFEPSRTPADLESRIVFNLVTVRSCPALGKGKRVMNRIERYGFSDSEFVALAKSIRAELKERPLMGGTLSRDLSFSFEKIEYFSWTFVLSGAVDMAALVNWCVWRVNQFLMSTCCRRCWRVSNYCKFSSWWNQPSTLKNTRGRCTFSVPYFLPYLIQYESI